MKRDAQCAEQDVKTPKWEPQKSHETTSKRHNRLLLHVFLSHSRWVLCLNIGEGLAQGPLVSQSICTLLSVSEYTVQRVTRGADKQQTQNRFLCLVSEVLFLLHLFPKLLDIGRTLGQVAKRGE